MIGLVIVTHGNLSIEFKRAMEHVVGEQEKLETVSISPEDDMEKRRQEISGAIEQVNDGDGVILLTDLFGGTPSNMAISLMQDQQIEVIAGINLPMLVKLASLRETSSLAEAAEKAQEAGRKYIHVASMILQGNS